MKKDNVEALKSSALVGVAFATSTGGMLYLTDNPHWDCFTLVSMFCGFLIGLLTTWYPEE